MLVLLFCGVEVLAYFPLASCDEMERSLMKRHLIHLCTSFLIALLLLGGLAWSSPTLAHASSLCASSFTEWSEAPIRDVQGDHLGTITNAFTATLFVNVPAPLPTLNFIGSIVVRILIGGPNFVGLGSTSDSIEKSSVRANRRFCAALLD